MELEGFLVIFFGVCSMEDHPEFPVIVREFFNQKREDPAATSVPSTEEVDNAPQEVFVLLIKGQDLQSEFEEFFAAWITVLPEETPVLEELVAIEITKPAEIQDTGVPSEHNFQDLVSKSNEHLKRIVVEGNPWWRKGGK